MQIGIIGGTGAEGRGVAARLAAAGVAVLLGSRQIEKAQDAAGRLRAVGGGGRIEAGTNDDVLGASDLIFLAVPFQNAAQLIAGQAGKFRPGTVVVDLTVPLGFSGGRPSIVELPEGSASEHLRARLPASVRLAASLKTVPAAVLGRLDEVLDCDEFVCADSAEARSAAADVLTRIAGLRLIDAGGLDAARAIERMTLLAVGLNKRYRVRGARFRVVGV
ncbi:MAG TPA: NADPH-dependent F420 reductase [Vicinamibacterales bacterium]|nr:NADPH-dependent F420 reductase [Vicinamibacterales bacterium]